MYTSPIGNDKIRLPIDYLTKLLVYKDKNNKIHNEVLTYIPHIDYILGKSNTFQGVLIVEDINGNILKRLLYENSKIYNLEIHSTQNPTTKTIDTNTIKPFLINTVVTTTCNSIDWYNCVGTDCTFTRTQDLGCTTSVTTTTTGGGDTQPNTPTGGDYSSNAPSKKVTNNIKNPCLKSMVDKLVSQNLTNTITTTFNSIFNLNNDFNVESGPKKNRE